MSDVEISYYKDFSIQALVYKYEPVGGRSHERLFEASVCIGSDDDKGEPSQKPAVFKLPANGPFLNFGDARRAAVVYAKQIIDGDVPGVSVQMPVSMPNE